MAWVESIYPSFRARHESQDASDTERLVASLEASREQLGELFPRAPGELTVVVHGSAAALLLAQPYLAAARALTAPAGRRYLVGWFGERRAARAGPPADGQAARSSVPGSRELLALAPQWLYASVLVGANNPELPPPFTFASFMRYMRWAWLAQGAAQYFSGQVEHLRPAIQRRLHEGPTPTFPPSVRDAPLLGGTVFDLLAREEGRPAAAQLACRPHPGGAGPALVKAFGGRALRHSEDAWRHHLDRLAGLAQQRGPRPTPPAPPAPVPPPGPRPVAAATPPRRPRARPAAPTAAPRARRRRPELGTSTSRGPAARKSGTSKPRDRRSRLGTPSSSSRPWMNSASAWLRPPATRTSSPSAYCGRICVPGGDAHCPARRARRPPAAFRTPGTGARWRDGCLRSADTALVAFAHGSMSSSTSSMRSRAGSGRRAPAARRRPLPRSRTASPARPPDRPGARTPG